MPKRRSRSVGPRRRRRPRHAPASPGSSPGQLQIPPEAPRPVVSAFLYDAESCREFARLEPRDLEPLLGEAKTLWVNVDGFGDEAVLLELARIFDLHSLALEDVVHLGQRARVEVFGDSLLIIARMPGGPEGTTEQLTLFLTPRGVVTFQERAGDCFDPVRERIRRGGNRIRPGGADYLAYALLDATVDAYFPLLDAWNARLEGLEEAVFTEPIRETLAQLHEARHELRELRRAISPHRDALGTLQHEVTTLIRDETRIYLRDCYDHSIRLVELTDVLHETCNDLVNAHLNMVNNRMNEVVKVLTIISTIFIPLSFVAGIYGMNFDPDASPWNMPELRWVLGYPFSLGLMGAVAAALAAFIWRKGWFK